MRPGENTRWIRLRSFRSFLQAGLSSSRSYGAVASTGLSSIANFVLSVSIARAGTVEAVAQFAIGFAGFMAISGITRSMISEPSAARLVDNHKLRTTGRQVSFYGLCFSVPLCLIGLSTGQLFLAAAGIFGHAIAMYDFSKFSATVFGRPLIAVAQEAFKAVVVITVIFIPEIAKDPLLLFVAWLIALAIAGYGGTILQRISMIPSWTKPQIPPKESASYAMDYVFGSGTTQITTFVLGGMASPAVNASIRGTGTLLGPITMVATSIRVLIIPFLSRKLRQNNDLGPATNVSLSLIIAATPLLIFVNLIPEHWGEALLADTWALAKVILPILSLELLATLLTNVPFAGHRSLGAYRRTLIIRSVLAPVRLITIVTAAVLGGYVWAAFAMLCNSLLGVITWWASYQGLMKQAVPTGNL